MKANNRQTKWILMHCFLFWQLLIHSQCNPTGAQTCTVSVNDAGAGSVAWSNPNNSQVSDNNYASAGQLLGVLATVQTNRLKLTSFGFSIPSTATVCGIEVSVRKNAAGLIVGSSINDKDVYIVKSNSLVGTNHAAGNWSGTNTWITYGSSADTWGTTWTPADINSNNFGFLMSANLNAGLAGVFLTANIDAITITVYYSDIVLGIALQKFEVYHENSKAKISWESFDDTRTKKYSLEKLDKANQWIEIGEAMSQKFSGINTYSLFDDALLNENYYRLKKVDNDGSSDYSRILFFRGYSSEIIVFPVPATDEINIQSGSLIEYIEIYNGLLQPVKRVSTGQAINISDLERGVYYLKIKCQNQPPTTKKFQKL